MKIKLTPKQELYCIYRAKGLPQILAYKQSYNTKSANENSIAVNANILEKDTKITLRVAELQTEFKEAAKAEYVWDKQVATKKILEIVNRIEFDLNQEQGRNKISATKDKALLGCFVELNKMYGIYENNVNVGGAARVIFLNGDEIDD